MRTVVCIFSVLLGLAPSAADAGWFDFGKKPQQQEMMGKPDYNKPAWKRGIENRRQYEWDKPGGVNFPTPGMKADNPAPTTLQQKGLTPDPNPTRPTLQQQGFFARLKLAWKKWKNRSIGADRQSVLANNAGFGDNVRRATPTVNEVSHKWRARGDPTRLGTKPPKPPSREPPAVKPPPRRGPPAPPPRRRLPPPVRPGPGWR
jgi:hypothetical protein